ncbi:YycC family protein [Paenibacillus sp. NPDC058071]|uniref:YycC family protein n=1 Tax=Paenibacillus sp. NPDC058071 TaxID=3346326 RepID=UPI0036D9CBD0
MSRPLQISPDTAVKLSQQLGVPIEHLMHMPRHILLQKLAELAKTESDAAKPADSASGDSADANPDSEDRGL